MRINKGFIKRKSSVFRKNVQKTELLMYNKMSGAKYRLAGLEYRYNFEQPTEEDLAVAGSIFKEYNINYSVRK